MLKQRDAAASETDATARVFDWIDSTLQKEKSQLDAGGIKLIFERDIQPLANEYAFVLVDCSSTATAPFCSPFRASPAAVFEGIKEELVRRGYLLLLLKRSNVLNAELSHQVRLLCS